jgi:hypothetical protein
MFAFGYYENTLYEPYYSSVSLCAEITIEPAWCDTSIRTISFKHAH